MYKAIHRLLSAIPVFIFSLHLNASPSTNLDTSFAIGSGVGIDMSVSHAINVVTVQTNGQVLAGGNGLFTNFNGTAISRLLRLNVNGSIDTAFLANVGAIVSGSSPGEIDDIKLQPDGKILIAGDFSSVAGVSRVGVARLNSDGTVDTSFMNAGGGVAGSTLRYVNTVLLLPNGKIMIGGGFTSYLGTSRNSVARLNSDGSLDTSFDTGAPTGANITGVLSLGVQSDGKIYVGGAFTNWFGLATPGIVRLYPNGALDSSFYPTHTIGGPQVNCLQVMPDNSVLIGGFIEGTVAQITRYFAKLNGNGSIDTSYPAGTGISGWVHAITPWPEGGYLIGGRFRDASGVACGELCLIDGSGNVDPNFATTPWNPIGQDLEHIYGVAVTPDSKIVLGGWFYNYPNNTQLNGQDYGGIVRLIGGSTGGAGKMQFVSSALSVGESDGSVTVGVVRFGGTSGAATVHYTTENNSAVSGSDYTGLTGILSWADGEGGVKTFTVPITSDSSAEAAENFTIGLSLPTGGTIGTPFHTTVTIIDDDSAPSITTPPQSQTVLLSFPALFTVLPAPGLTPSFQWLSNGVSINNATQGFLLLTNVQTNFAASYSVILSNAFGLATSAVATLTVTIPAGLPDPTFFQTTNSFNGDVYDLIPGTNNTFIAAGQFTQFGGVTTPAYLGRVTTNGTIDPTFNPGGAGANAFVYSVSSYPDGRLLIGGTFSSYNGTNRAKVARLNADGTLDTTFTNLPNASVSLYPVVVATADGGGYIGENGFVAHALPSGTNDTNFIQIPLAGQVYAMAVQGDGKIVAAPYHSSPVYSELVRLNTNGTRDQTFTAPQFLGQIQSLGILPDGRIAVSGLFTNVGGLTVGRVAVVLTNGAFDTNFAANVGSGADSAVIDLSVTADGKLLFGGDFTTWNGATAGRFIRLLPDGTKDPAFVVRSGANSFVRAISSDASGRVALGGSFTQVNGLTKQSIAVLTFGAGFIQFASNQLSVVENGVSVPVTVQRVNGSRDAASVNFATASGTATSGTDFISTNGTLTWTNGETSAKTFNVTIVDNGAANVDKTFTVNLSNLTGNGGYGFYTNLTVTILDNDSAPRITVQPVSLISPEDVTASFSITANSALPLFYQWRSNNIAILNATNATLLLTNVQSNFVASYSVAVTNTVGPTISSNATLSVIPNAGRIDTTFSAPTLNGNVRAIVPLGDGRVLIGGDFTTPKSSLALLSATGAVDNSFTNTTDGQVYDIVRDNQGRFLIVGNFTQFAGKSISHLVRLNADYTVDTNFLSALGAAPNSRVRAVAVGPDGKIWLGGDFTSIGGPYAMKYTARLNDNGTLDVSYAPRPNNVVLKIVPTTNGGAFVGGSFTSWNGVNGNSIRRIKADGSIDTNWAPTAFPNGSITGTFNDIVVAPDGSVYAAGALNSNGPTNHIAHFDATGKLDVRFMEGTRVSATSGTAINSLALQTDGGLLAGGAFTFFGASSPYLGRVATNGFPDASFSVGTGFNFAVLRTVLEGNGAIWVGGQFTTYKGNAAQNLVRLNGTATGIGIGQQPLDRVAPTAQATVFTATAVGTAPFGYQWLKNGSPLANGGNILGANTTALTVSALAAGDEGSYALVATNVTGASATSRAARLSVRTTPVILASPVGGVVPLGGRILLSGQAEGVPVLSYQWYQNATPVGNNGPVLSITNAPLAASGSYTLVVSNSFGTATSAVAVVSVQITPATAVTNFFTDAGTLNFSDTIQALAPATNGLIVGGNFTSVKTNGSSTTPRFYVAMFSTNGTLLPFNPWPNSQIYDIVRQNDGKVLIGGTFTSVNTNAVARNYLVRYNADGTLDTAFTNALGTGPNDVVNDIALQADGGILIAGNFLSVSGKASTRGIARLNPDGSVDTNFVSLATGNVTALDILTDGRIVLAGSGYGGVSSSVFRVSTNGAVDASFRVSGSFIQCIAAQGNNVLIGGTFTTLTAYTPVTNTFTRPILARFNSDGSLDTNFLAGVTNATFNNQAIIRTIAVQANGRILAGGNFYTFGAFRNGLLRVNADGTQDTSFVFQQGAGDDSNASIYRIALFPDGRIAIGGTSMTWEGVTENNLVILAGDPVIPPVTFDTWATSAGLTGGNNGANQDPDGDGVANVFEYYFGTSPTNAFGNVLPTGGSVKIGTNSYPTIRFVRSQSNTAVTATVSVSSTVTFADSLGSTVQSVTDLGNGTEAVVIRSNVSDAVKPTQFLKLTLTLP